MAALKEIDPLSVTVPSVASSEAEVIVTFAVGLVFSTTVKVAVPPTSVVFALADETVMPAVCISVTLTVTSLTGIPL